MPSRVKSLFDLLKTSGKNWIDDKAPRLGAAVAYYTVFAIPPLFVIILYLVSLVVDPETIRQQMFSEVGGMIGEQSAETIESAMTAQMENKKGTFASILALLTLIVTATGLFMELQSALNSIWGVEEKPGQGIKGFIVNRVLSFTMVIGIGFLLLVSLVVSAGLSALGKYVSVLVPGLDILWMIANAAVSFAVITLLFAMIFKVLPDVKIAWKDVWVGALITSLLFTAGKFALGLYLGKSTAVTAYGAAGSLVLILLWVYYSSQILFFGAEVTQVYANRFGATLRPAENAQWIAERRPNLKKPGAKSVPGKKGKLISDIEEEVESLRRWLDRRRPVRKQGEQTGATNVVVAPAVDTSGIGRRSVKEHESPSLP